ncbi:MAG TPA: Npt1/Npt2 family nucleotide transporter [Myxococcota bacterium]|jgi:HEAT repeat protein|nr:Npt1/Npt2 family nucleotide transporter [Myxococcota bacterium]
MLARLLRGIGVRDGEGSRLARLVALIFALSAAVVIAKAAQSGIFLSAYPRAAIPIAFTYSALVLAGVSFLASAFAERLGPLRLAAATMAVSAAFFAGGRLLLTSKAHVVPLVVYVGIEALTGLLLIQGWAVVTEAVDVRSAKRLLPLVGNGASIAWAAGGFGTSGLVHLVGTEQLLLIAPVLLAVSLVLVRAIERYDLGGRAARGSRTMSLAAGARAGLRYVAAEPLMKVIAALAVLALLVEQILDFQLMAAVRERYLAPAGITAFMGLFYGATGVITVLAQLGLSGRLLSRLSSARAVQVSPAVTAAGSAAFLLFPAFGLAAALRGSDRVLKQALGSPALEQIHIPIPPVRRAQARALVKGVLAPLFYALGGLAMQLLPATMSIRWLSLATVALAGASAVIAGTWLHKAYVAALRRAVDQRRLDLEEASGQRPGLDREQCGALAAEVRSGDPKRAIFALDLLSRGEPILARPLVLEALANPDPDVRAAAVAGLARFGRSDDAQEVATVLASATEDVVERACLSALGALGTQGLGRARLAVEKRTADVTPEVRALARASLARTGDDDAAAALAAMLRSEDEKERAAAAWATGELMLRRTVILEAFADTLSDPAAAVRVAAIRATGQLQQERFVRAVAWALSDPKTAAAAAHAVGQWSDAMVDRLDEALRGAPVRAVARATAALAHGSGPRGDALLSRLLLHDDAVVRYRAARALATRRRLAPRRALGAGGNGPAAGDGDGDGDGLAQTPPRATLVASLRRELSLGYGYYALLIGVARTDGVDDYEIEPQFHFLASELLARIRRVEKRVLALLALVVDPRLVHAAELRLRNPTQTVAAQAVELLEHALDSELARLVVPFFERRPLRMRLQSARDAFPVPPKYLADPLGGIMQLHDPHLRHCAMWTYQERFAREYPAEHREESRLLPLVERIYFLRGVPLFAELSGEDLRQVAEIVEEVEFEAGDLIFRKGDPGEALYLIVRGRVVARDREYEIAQFGPKEFFGDLAVLDHEPRSTDVACTEDAQLLRIAAADLEELMERRPEIANGIIKVLARRLREATAKLAT